MAAGRPVYWDTCVFLAWIKGEQRRPGQMDGVREMVGAVDDGTMTVLTSVVTRIEVLQSTLSEESRSLFRRALQRRSIQSVACDMRIAEKAHEIRDFYKSRGMNLTTPDAIHLATAIVYSTETFFTFDGLRPTGPKSTRVGLLALSGNVAGHGLEIKQPMATPSLFSMFNSNIEIAHGLSDVEPVSPPPAQRGALPARGETTKDPNGDDVAGDAETRKSKSSEKP